MPLDLDTKDAWLGDSADTLTVTKRGCHVNPSVTPFMFSRVTVNDGRPVQILMVSYDKTPVGEFIGPGADENATRLCAMLRLCDGIGTDVLHQLCGKLSEILDTPRFPAAKAWLVEDGP